MTAEIENLQAKAAEFGVRFFETIPESFFDASLISALPVTWARARCVLPVRADGEATLLVADPDGLESLQRASLVAGEELIPAFATRQAILAAIDAAFFAGKSTAAQSSDRTQDAAQDGAGNGESAVQTSSSDADLLVERTEPVVRFLNDTILEATRRGASDIHLEPESDSASGRVRFRISGQLYDQTQPPRGMSASIVSRVKVLAGMDIAERRLPQDGMIQVRIGGGKTIDVRVSTIPVSDGERVVLRLLNRDDSLLPLSALGMPEDVLADFSSLLSSPNGIIVVSGPTGAGKTTTLYSALGSIDAIRRNVMTIEDPVEYRLPHIAQIQVKPKIGLTFASGLRHILRQDPDVVLVGETRDAETAEIAVRASLTGHLVFTTLHTNDAPSAVMRLVDMGIEPYLLASCLRGVLAQRLVRKACPHCRSVVPFGASGLVRSEEVTARAAGCGGVLRVAGCGQCLEGYVGRVGIFELLQCAPAVAEAIHEGKIAAAPLRTIAENAGAFRALREDAIRKLRALETTPAEVLSALGAI